LYSASGHGSEELVQITANGIRMSYEVAGPESQPTLLFSHSLGASLGMWKPQLSELGRELRVVAYDLRGHGATQATPGGYSLDLLAADACALLDALEIDKVWFVGLSIGGMIGQVMALSHAQRLHGVVLVSTLSELPQVARDAMAERIRRTLDEGMEPQVEPAIERWFTADFRREAPPVLDEVRAMIRSCDPLGYAGCTEAVRRLALTAELHRIRVPTLVIAGAEDPGAGPVVARSIHERIAGSELLVIAGAAHLVNIERAEELNRALRRFVRINRPPARAGAGFARRDAR
jgi:3-oxoadipate enol-lactonase